MNAARVALGVFVSLLAVGDLTASGPVGIYGVIERVVFEPDESAAQRIQVWGAFAFVEGGSRSQVLPRCRNMATCISNYRRETSRP
jgi:hypothetical protein